MVGYLDDVLSSKTHSAIFGRKAAMLLFDDVLTSFLCSNYIPPLRLEVSVLCVCAHAAIP